MAQGKINVSVENIFPLIKKFLYSDHEIFLRELISNATDATLKLKHLTAIGEAKVDYGNPQIEIKIDKPRDYFVNADKDKIRQVLVNLIVNAVKYGIQGGWVKIQFTDMDGSLMVEVEDNGIGIDEKHLPRLFERFYRVDESRSRELGGSGLGLAIVKHILDAHQQNIGVRSSVKSGSVFYFTLAKGKK